ncbi:hypothetical protein C8F01DRAFT_1233321 [Mycena amicta]|nr:hypothetical protein C8F01DRAFT_1233321 [Mycena amicta]
MVNGRLLVKPSKNGKQMRKTISVRYYHTLGRPVQITTPILHTPGFRTNHNDFIAIDNILGGYRVQPRVHEIYVGVDYCDDRGFHTEEYMAFYKNHDQLPYNLHLDIKGELAIVRKSEGGPVNLRMCDRRVADFIAVSLQAAINKIQHHRAPKRPLIKILSMPKDYSKDARERCACFGPKSIAFDGALDMRTAENQARESEGVKRLTDLHSRFCVKLDSKKKHRERVRIVSDIQRFRRAQSGRKVFEENLEEQRRGRTGRRESQTGRSESVKCLTDPWNEDHYRRRTSGSGGKRFGVVARRKRDLEEIDEGDDL